MPKQIVLIELHQETNSFSKVPTTLREFESLALYYGEEVLSHGIKRTFFVIKLEIPFTNHDWTTALIPDKDHLIFLTGDQ